MTKQRKTVDFIGLCGVYEVEPMSGIEPPTYGLRNHYQISYKLLQNR